jgi:hypothetical protein
MNRLPINGPALLAMRQNLKRPDGVVLASLCGYLERFSNFQLLANPAVNHDWQVITGLEVEVIASRAVPFADVLRHLDAIARATPAHLTLGFLEGPQIECGQARYALHTINPNTGRMLFDWYPLAIGPAHFKEARMIERRMRAELGLSLFEPIVAAEARTLEAMKKQEAAWHA